MQSQPQVLVQEKTVSNLSMSQKRARSPSPASIYPSRIFKSSPIEDRSSRFIAFYSPTVAAKELQAHIDLKSASHRIAAWRRLSRQGALDAKRLLEIGHDDDGEKYGGKALEKVLVETEVEGAVVVARWYGGVMLGPVRFDHIKNCARDAIMQWSSERERSAKKAKFREDEAERTRLIQILPERDQSITVLRDLLAEKNQQSSSASGEKRSPAKTPDYSTLPLATLEKLEQVRDATIGWILKQIEKVEKAQAEETDAQRVPTPTASEMPKGSTNSNELSATSEESEAVDLKKDTTESAASEVDNV